MTVYATVLNRRIKAEAADGELRLTPGKNDNIILSLTTPEMIRDLGVQLLRIAKKSWPGQDWQDPVV